MKTSIVRRAFFGDEKIYNFKHLGITSCHTPIDPVFTVDDHSWHTRDTVRPDQGLGLLHTAAHRKGFVRRTKICLIYAAELIKYRCQQACLAKVFII